MRLTYTVCFLSLLLLIHTGEHTTASQPNLALGKPTEQINDLLEMYSSLAVDGKYALTSPNCAHTRQATRPWWVVDLLGEYDVSWIRLYNRADCCSERLSNFTISVGNDTDGDGVVEYTPCYYYDGEYGLDPQLLPCNATEPARYVKIQLTATERLTLCEVEIYAQYPSADVTTTSLLSSVDVKTHTGSYLTVSTTVDMASETSTLQNSHALKVYSISTSPTRSDVLSSTEHLSSDLSVSTGELFTSHVYLHTKYSLAYDTSLLSTADNTQMESSTVMGSPSDAVENNDDEMSLASSFDSTVTLASSDMLTSQISSPPESSASFLDVSSFSPISGDVTDIQTSYIDTELIRDVTGIQTSYIDTELIRDVTGIQTSYIDTELMDTSYSTQTDSVLSETSKPSFDFQYADTQSSLVDEVLLSETKSTYMSSTSTVLPCRQLHSCTMSGDIHQQDFASSAIQSVLMSSVPGHSENGGTVLSHSTTVSLVSFVSQIVQHVCTCRCKLDIPTDVSMAKNEAKELRDNLLLDRKNLSQYIRTKISAENKVPSSGYIGWFGMTLFGLLIAVIFIPDAVMVAKYLFTNRRKSPQSL